jgi:hypothetical protein
MVAKYGGQVRYDFEDTRYRAGAPRRYPSRYGRLRKLLGEDFFYRVVAVEIGTRFHAYQSPAQAMLDDDGFRLIAALSELRILKVAGSRLTDEGAKRVSSLIHLEELQLSGPSIAEETVAAIAQLPRLRRLALMSPQITDAAIETIGSMKDLQEVDLRETSVSREGLNRLHELLPETWISH